MTFSLENFNTEEAASGFIDYSQPIPANTYNTKVVKSEHDENKAGDGTQLYIQLEVVEGPHAGRRVSTWFKTHSTQTDPNMQQWVKDDLSKMAMFFKAVLGRKPTRFSELMDRKAKARVGINKNMKNDIKGFAPMGNQMPQLPPQQAAPMPPNPSPVPPRPSNGIPQGEPAQPWLSTPVPKTPVQNVNPDDVPF
tara:strand:- start:5905 stop:6486 length:582 start_codon:yes stop_codon:yes gene_type:complete